MRAATSFLNAGARAASSRGPPTWMTSTPERCSSVRFIRPSFAFDQQHAHIIAQGGCAAPVFERPFNGRKQSRRSIRAMLYEKRAQPFHREGFARRIRGIDEAVGVDQKPFPGRKREGH